MITVPTCELVGILSDVAPFAFPETELPAINAIRIEWDGDMLHALATDRYSIGWSRWHPNDGAGDEENEGALIAKWGGADHPWSVLLPLADANDIVKNFKLGAKAGWTPLTVEERDGRLRVIRSGRSSLQQFVEGAEGLFPNVRAILAATALPESIDGIAFNTSRLAAFAKVRPRGPVNMTFNGAHKPVHVSIGDRFSGAIMPFRDKPDDAQPDSPEQPEL